MNSSVPVKSISAFMFRSKTAHGCFAKTRIFVYDNGSCSIYRYLLLPKGDDPHVAKKLREFNGRILWMSVIQFKYSTLVQIVQELTKILTSANIPIDKII